MTTQEAIKMLKDTMDGKIVTTYELAECVRIAINALERVAGKTEPTIAPDPDALVFTASTDDIKSAAEQRANQEIWRREQEVAGWRATVAELTDAINNLWRSGGSYVLFWEEQWFPGYEDFLEKIQKLGYHVYLQTENRDDTPLSRFIITLDYTGGREKWEEWKRPTEAERG